MPTSHRIILVGLDDQSRSVLGSCLPNDRFKITQVDPASTNDSHEEAHLVVFTLAVPIELWEIAT